MNCTALDTYITNIDHAITQDIVIFVIFTSTLSLLSLVLLIYGQFIVRITSTLVTAVATTIAVYVFSALIQSIPCIIRVAIAGVTGFLAMLLTYCLICMDPILIGGAAFGAATHYTYTALPLSNIPSPFTLLGESSYYYIVMCIAVGLGCVVACFTKETFLQLCSSLIGGAATATVVDVICLRMGSYLSPFTFPIVLFSTAIAGVLAQKYMQRSRQTPHRSRYDESNERRNFGHHRASDI